MRSLIFPALHLLSGISVAAQQLAYTSFIVTECVTEASSMPDPGVAPIVNTKPGYQETITLSYTMPPCTSCGCPGCTLVSSFTTTCLAFHTAAASGVTAQSYAITETYIGLSSLPSFDEPTQMPYGFTSSVHTCNAGVCGPEAITATMTYPSGGGPFVAAPLSEHCSTLSTQHQNTVTPATGTAVPVPVPAQPTMAVVSRGNVKKPLEIIVLSVFFLVATVV
ncbi:hypothetical protein F5B22DRAFT_661758 [Xylaria bambusicola]|uniref:uncharacterized protein n=1 Tax=Xylaria bambusicola TaxID=326684 RepID=UPI0020072CB0|nr:uncharacterized protein F5B22DRAFT_661758 [Xylaria bambusicola]KAI0505207.1 hypothetical protein F5B22DRAFT_661758 [Xylaria bambusicola]